MRTFNYHTRQRFLLQILLDYGMVVLIMLSIMILHGGTPRQVMPQAATQGLSLATWLFLVGSASGIYDTSPQQSWQRICVRTLLTAVVGVPVAYLLFTLIPDGGNHGLVSFAATAGVAAVILHRVYVSHASPRTARSKVLIVGSGAAAQMVAGTLRTNPYADLVGYYPASNENVEVPQPELISAGSLVESALKLGVSEIVVAVSERRGGSMPMRALLDCKIQGIRVWDVTTYFEKALGQIRLDFVNAGWLIFGDGFKQGMVRTAVKRLSDIVASLVLLVVFAPIMLVTACLIALESRGPVLFRQERVGLNGRTFNVLKFRSMRTDAEADGRPRWAVTDDDRVTQVGRVIRRLRIDEFPQLLNVLAGEMSLIGPRPERPYFVAELTSRIPYYAVRHSIKPGVTGWAQVRYHYGATVEDAQEKLQYDLYYVKNHSLLLDWAILLETIAVVLTGRGAR